MHRAGKWCTSAAIRDYLGKPFLTGDNFANNSRGRGRGLKRLEGKQAWRICGDTSRDKREDERMVLFIRLAFLVLIRFRDLSGAKFFLIK